MTTTRTRILVLAISLLSAGFAGAKGNEPGARAMNTVKDLKSDVVASLEGLEMQRLNVDDASVSLSFIVNKDGDLTIVSVDGENCLVNTYAAQMLRNKKISVAEHLADKVHTVKVRFVRI